MPTGSHCVVSGLPVLRVGIVRDLEKDQVRLMPLAGVLYLITLALAFRSLSGSLLPLFAVGQGLVWTFGLIAVRGQPLNIVSNILPCMLLINGVSNSIHVLTRYSEEAVHPGREPQRGQPADHSTDDRRLPGGLRDGGLRLLRPANGQFARAARVRHASGDGPLVSVSHGDFDARLVASLLQAAGVPGIPAWQSFLAVSADARHVLVRWHGRLSPSFLRLRASRSGGPAVSKSIRRTLETYDEKQPTIQTLRTAREPPVRPVAAGDQPDGGQARPVLSARTSTARWPSCSNSRWNKSPCCSHGRTSIISTRSTGICFTSDKGRPRPDRTKRRTATIGPASHLLLCHAGADEMRYCEFMTHDEKRARRLLKIRDVGTRNTLALVPHARGQDGRALSARFGYSTEVTGDAYVDAVGLTEMIHELLFSILTAALVIFGLIALLFRSRADRADHDSPERDSAGGHVRLHGVPRLSI